MKFLKAAVFLFTLFPNNFAQKTHRLRGKNLKPAHSERSHTFTINLEQGRNLEKTDSKENFIGGSRLEGSPEPPGSSKSSSTGKSDSEKSSSSTSKSDSEKSSSSTGKSDSEKSSSSTGKSDSEKSSSSTSKIDSEKSSSSTGKSDSGISSSSTGKNDSEKSSSSTGEGDSEESLKSEEESPQTTAIDDEFTTIRGTSLLIDVLENDLDATDEDLLFESFKEPEFGVLEDKGGGVFVYTPRDDDFVGQDTFEYTVLNSVGEPFVATVLINVVTDPESVEFAMDDYYTIDSGSTLTVSAPGILANDIVNESGMLTVDNCAEPNSGTFFYETDGSFVFIPGDFLGVQSIDCIVVDEFGKGDISTIVIVVRETNFEASVTTNEDVPLMLSLDNDDWNLASCGIPMKGSTSLNADGTYTYTPAPNFFGTDFVDCTVQDSNGLSSTITITIVISPVNDLPVAYPDSYSTSVDTPITLDPLVNDIDVDGDTLTIETTTQIVNGEVVSNGDGTLTFTPTASGEVTFDYTISDGNGGSSTSTITISVEDIGEDTVLTAVFAVNDFYTTPHNTELAKDATLGVLANDNGNDLRVISYTQPLHGTLSINAFGSFTYTPDNNRDGLDVFEYVVFDGSETDTGVVTIEVLPNEGEVSATSDFYSTFQETSITIAGPGILENDEFVDKLISVTSPDNGTLEQFSDGGFIYTPNPTFTGVDTYQYTVGDTNGNTVTATVSINVQFVNLPPLIIPGGAELISLDGTDTSQRSSDCAGADYTDCDGVNTASDINDIGGGSSIGK